MEINPKAVHLVRLSEDELPDLVDFDCGDQEMNRFLKEEAFDEQAIGMNSTVLLYYMGSLAAFCSVCCDSIPLSTKEQREEEIPRYKVPSIKIARLGRSVRFSGYGFGGFLINYVKSVAFELGTSRVGVRFLTLDAYPNKVKYYEGFGFVRNEAMKPGPSGNVSMRADIFD